MWALAIRDREGVCFRSAGLTSWTQDSASWLYYITEQSINQSVGWLSIQPESHWARGMFVMSETFPSSLVLSCSCHWFSLTDEQSRDFTQDRKSALCPLLPNPWPMGFSYYLLAPACTAGMWFILRSLATFLSLVMQGKVCWPGSMAALTFHWTQCQQKRNAPVSGIVTPFQTCKWVTAKGGQPQHTHTLTPSHAHTIS